MSIFGGNFYPWCCLLLADDESCFVVRRGQIDENGNTYNIYIHVMANKRTKKKINKCIIIIIMMI